MKVLVLSCDKNKDTFEPFHHCIEKYWSSHPEIIYKTETVLNSYYKTICTNYPLSSWTKGVRDALKQIDDNHVLLMMDDIFIRQAVDTERIYYADTHFKETIAMFNFEKSFDINDEDTDLIGFKKRRHNSDYEVSIMCGLWDKNKLLNVIADDSDPWTVEFKQNNCNYDYYINSDDYIIDWGYRTWQPSGIFKGRWCREIVSFFEQENIKIDYSVRGFVE